MIGGRYMYMYIYMQVFFIIYVLEYVQGTYFQAYQLSIYKLTRGEKEHTQYTIHVVNILREFNLCKFTARENKSTSKISTCTVLA